MVRTSHNKPKYGSGGWFKDNISNIAQVGLGAAAMTVPGLQPVGTSLLAGGAMGMLTPTQSRGEDPNAQMNDWIVNNRNYSMNNRSMNPSMFFQYGGRISKMRPDPMSVTQDPMRGGHLEKEATNVRRAVGKTHEQGGIELPGGEIEHGESLVTSPYNGEVQVHSDELGYADQTNELADYKGKLEEQLALKVNTYANLMDEQNKLNSKLEDTSDRFKTNSIKREFDKLANQVNRVQAEMEGLQFEISNVDAQIEQNFQMQEQENAQMGMDGGQPMGMDGGQPMFQYGGTFNPPLARNPHIWQNTIEEPPFYPIIPNGERRELPRLSGTSPATLIPRSSLIPHNQNANPDLTLRNSAIMPKRNLPELPERQEFAMANSIDGRVKTTPDVTSLVQSRSVPGLEGAGSPDGGSGFISDMIPYADTIVNAFLNRRLSNMKPPQMDKVNTPTMDANYNINPQLQNIQSQTAAANEFIQSNVSASPVARASHANTRIQNMQMVNNLYGEKHNAESQIRNQNLAMAADTDYKNAAIGYQNDLANFNSEVAGIERTSQNVANGVSKYNQKVTQDRLKEYQDKQLGVLRAQYEGTSIVPDLVEGMEEESVDKTGVKTAAPSRASARPSRGTSTTSTGSKSEAKPPLATAVNDESKATNLTTFRQILGDREQDHRGYQSNRPGSQYQGRYQFGNLALQDLGLIDKDGNWNNDYGINSAEEFKNSDEAQEAAMDRWVGLLDSRLKKANAYDEWVGKEFKGVKITENGLRAIAHLQGVKGALDALKAGKDIADGLGTTLTEYLKLFV